MAQHCGSPGSQHSDDRGRWFRRHCPEDFSTPVCFAINLELDPSLVVYLAPLSWLGLANPEAEPAHREAIALLETMLDKDDSTDQQILYCVDVSGKLLAK